MDDYDDVMDWAPKEVARFELDSSAWQEKAREIYAFKAGDHWSGEALAERKRKSLPSLTFNKFAKFHNSLLGTQIASRPWIHFRDVGWDDFRLSQVINTTFRATTDERFETEISDAASDCLQSGVGCVFLGMQLGRMPRASLQRVHPFEMGWDIAANQRGFADRRYNWRRKRYSRMEMIDNFGEEKANECFAARAASQLGFRTPEEEAAKPHEVVHFQWRRERIVNRFLVTDRRMGGVFDLSEDEHDQFRDLFKNSERFDVERHRELEAKYYHITFSGTTVLIPKAELPFGFTYCFLTGNRGRDDKFWSPLEAGIDPQKFYNYVFSTAVHDYATAGKGLLVEDMAVDNFEKFAAEYASAEKVKKVAMGAISQGKIKQLDGASVSPALAYLLQTAENSISSVLGVNAEILGMAGVEQSNILERTRQNASLTSFQEFFSSERQLRKELGRLILGFMQRYYTDEALIRINGPDIVRDGTLNKIRDLDVAVADIEIDQEPRTASQREETLAALQAMAHQLGQATPPGFVTAMLKYSPLPPADVAMIQQSMQPKETPADQLALREKMAKIEKTAAETQKTAAETQKIITEIRAAASPPAQDAARVGQMLIKGQLDAAADARKAALSRQTHEQDLREQFAKDALDGGRAARDVQKQQFLTLLKSQGDAP